jgi:2,3-bisphosphoglycerate-independent phosphoglycerate mutase
MLKLLLLVVDGMGDRPVPALGGMTPLEYAETPNMDSLARRGTTGLMYSVGKGIAPQSHTGVISVLGYDPFKYSASRGVLEAVGAGASFRDGDLALRANFVTLGEGLNISDRRTGRDLSNEDSKQLSEEVNWKVRLASHPAGFELRSTIGYRGIFLLKTRGVPLSDNITGTDPAYGMERNVNVAKAKFRMMAQKSRPLDHTEAARASADLVNEFSAKVRPVLEASEVNKRRAEAGKLVANYVLVRDAGAAVPIFPDINKLYGVRFACVANMPVEKGIAKLTGMETIELSPPSGDPAADCELAADMLVKSLRGYDCFYVHIKGPDEPGHDGDCGKKAKLLEVVDRSFFGRLKDRSGLDRFLICVTADHATPCVAKVHTDDPVPLLISGGGVQSDGSKAFSERTSARGSLGTLAAGVELMPRLVTILKKSRLGK